MITDTRTKTNVREVANGIYRINTPIDIPGGPGFSFNQYLLFDDDPLLFHTGPRELFPSVRSAIAALMPVEDLRYVAFSHVEADECGSLNLLLGAAPLAVPLCSRVAAMVSVNDISDRPPRALADGEQFSTGGHVLQWIDTPHVPHGWDSGLLMDMTSRTLFCGDLFTQPGYGEVALTNADILGPSEAFRQQMDYFAHGPETLTTLTRLADFEPRTLACMHGSAWSGEGSALLRKLANAIAVLP